MKNLLIAIASIITLSASAQNVETQSKELTIGTHYGGGIIFYILQPGDIGYDPKVLHGIIAAPTDQSTGIQFGCQGTTTGASCKEIGTGKANTKRIIKFCHSAGAADLCRNLTLGGYKDWYLPSLDELNELYNNQDIIGGFASGSAYWSSSEYGSDRAWFLYFYNGNQSNYLKNHFYYVRAIRFF